MRRSDEAFKAELMFRVENKRMVQRRRRKALSTAAMTAAGIVIVTILTLPRMQAESIKETEQVWMYTELTESITSEEVDSSDISCVRITSISVQTAQQEACTVDSAAYDEVMALLEELRLGSAQSPTESAMEAPEVSAESTVISSNTREEVTEQTEEFYQLAIEYGNGHSQRYRLLQADAFSIVMGDDETIMYLPESLWEQAKEEMKQVLSE